MKETKVELPTIPNLDDGIYGVITAVLWIASAAILLKLLWNPINNLLVTFIKRIQAGAALKIGALELSAFRVFPEIPPSNRKIYVKNSDSECEMLRGKIYNEQKRLFIAHKLFSSSEPNQLYDILIYLISHNGQSGNGDLSSVQKVEYYFGSMWGNKVFESEERNSRFAVVVSAYGSGFLCLARIHIKGEINPVEAWRYIDFEQGLLGSDTPSPSRTQENVPPQEM